MKQIKKCAFCHHGKGYHYDESIRGVTQLPCNFTWDEDGRPVSCLCYGWCETKEEAEKLVREESCPTCLHLKSVHDDNGCNGSSGPVKCNCPGLWKAEPDELPGTPIIGPIGGYEIFGGYEIYLMATCAQCGHMKSMHIGRCKQMMESDSRQYECGCNQMFSGGGQEYDPEKDGEPMEPQSTNAFIIKREDRTCICGHSFNSHYDEPNSSCRGTYCRCESFSPTTAEQSSSYSKSPQSEPERQYEERQALVRFQCKDQHVHTVVNQLARMANTLKSDPLAELAPERELLYRIWLALYLCEAIECRAWHTLVARAQSSLLPQLRNSLRKHKEPPNSDGQ